MKIKIPQRRALVVICGPSCSGKTTLAQRITEMIPHENKYRFSSDEEKLAIMDQTPDLRCWRWEVMHNPYCAQDTLPKRVLLQLTKATGDRLIETIRTYPLVIYDSVFIYAYLLQQHLMAMLAFSDPDQPLVLIKVLADDEIFEDFYRQRERQGQMCLPVKKVLLQRYTFERQILLHDFRADFRRDDVLAQDRLRMAHQQGSFRSYNTTDGDELFRRTCAWRGKMFEYAVTDPREVEIELI